MILGMSTSAFTALHVVLSLIGILAGFAVVAGMFGSKTVNGWTAIFLAATVLTSVTGFFFPVHHFMPSHGVGILSLLVLSISLYARYGRNLAGHWRWGYVVTAMLAFYFNVFVLVAQLFAKVPALKALAPTQTEPPFGITQLAVLLIFVALTIAATRRFHTASASGPILRAVVTSA